MKGCMIARQIQLTEGISDNAASMQLRFRQLFVINIHELFCAFDLDIKNMRNKICKQTSNREFKKARVLIRYI